MNVSWHGRVFPERDEIWIWHRKGSGIVKILCFPCVFDTFRPRSARGLGYFYFFLPAEWMYIWSQATLWDFGPSTFQDIFISFYPLNECISGPWLMPGLVGAIFWPLYPNFWPLYRARIPIHLGRGPKIRISICQPVWFLNPGWRLSQSGIKIG